MSLSRRAPARSLASAISIVTIVVSVVALSAASGGGHEQPPSGGAGLSSEPLHQALEARERSEAARERRIAAGAFEDELDAAIAAEADRRTIVYASKVHAAKVERGRQEALRRQEVERQRAREAASSVQAAPQAPAASPPTTQAAVRPAGACGGWEGLIAAHFPADQVARACRVMMCESQGNPTAQNPRSSASGLFQFLSGTWTSVTGTPAPASAYSPDTQVAAAAALWRSSGWSPWVCR